MSWDSKTIQYAHLIIIVGLLNATTKEIIGALIHNIFVKK